MCPPDQQQTMLLLKKRVRCQVRETIPQPMGYFAQIFASFYICPFRILYATLMKIASKHVPKDRSERIEGIGFKHTSSWPCKDVKLLFPLKQDKKEKE